METQQATIQPLSVGLKRAAALTGLSERSLRYYIASRQLQVCRAGRRLLVPLSSLREFIETPQHPGPTAPQEEKAQGQS